MLAEREQQVLDAEARERRRQRFGMREIGTSDGRVVLNGRPVFLLGALDQDLYPTTISTPPNKAYLDEQMHLSREMGLNLLRCHIKVPDPRYVRAADELGILVWEEIPNWLFLTDASRRRARTRAIWSGPIPERRRRRRRRRSAKFPAVAEPVQPPTFVPARSSVMRINTRCSRRMRSAYSSQSGFSPGKRW